MLRELTVVPNRYRENESCCELLWVNLFGFFFQVLHFVYFSHSFHSYCSFISFIYFILSICLVCLFFSFIHFIHTFIHSYIHSYIHWFIDSLIYPLIHLSSIHSNIYLFLPVIHSIHFISFIHIYINNIPWFKQWRRLSSDQSILFWAFSHQAVTFIRKPGDQKLEIKYFDQKNAVFTVSIMSIPDHALSIFLNVPWAWGE